MGKKKIKLSIVSPIPCFPGKTSLNILMHRLPRPLSLFFFHLLSMGGRRRGGDRN